MSWFTVIGILVVLAMAVIISGEPDSSDPKKPNIAKKKHSNLPRMEDEMIQNHARQQQQQYLNSL